MKKITVLLALLCFLSVSLFAQTDAKNKAKAQKYVEDAVKLVLKQGNQKACEVFTNPKGGFIEGEYYISHIAFDGIVICHGVKPDLNGKNLWAIKDPNGVFLVQEIIKQAQSKDGQGWANYSWPSPETNLITPKTTFVKKIPGKNELIHVGIYLTKK